MSCKPSYHVLEDSTAALQVSNNEDHNLTCELMIENSFKSGGNSTCIVTEWDDNSKNKKKNTTTSTTTSTTPLDNASQFVNLFNNGKVLSEDSKRLLCVPNAGGNSVFSEVLSFEFVKALFEKLSNNSLTVSLHKTEMELEYAEGSKITDFALKLVKNETNESTLLGCSVTRCFNFMDLNSVVSDVSVKQLLTKKLLGVISSTNGVLNDKWNRQILHIWTTNMETAQAIKRVFENDISPEVKSNTIVLVTVACEGMECIYREKGDDAKMAMAALGLSPICSEEEESSETSSNNDELEENLLSLTL